MIMTALLVIIAMIVLLVRHAIASVCFNDTNEPRQNGKFAPKVFVISMFESEAQTWDEQFPSSGLGTLGLLTIDVPGLSMLFPHVYCTADGDVCHIVAGEGEVNAAASVMALALSEKFDLSRTYFLLAGIAGVNPRRGTLGTVAFARYAVQVALQYEIDSRSLPPFWPSGYIAFGRDRPGEYPSILYGTEVFEVNDNLRQVAFKMAKNATLVDSPQPREYRAKYRSLGKGYELATRPPGIVMCDVATSDVYYSGTRLSEAFEATVTLWSNGSAQYCMTAQEDTAILEIMVRAAIQRLVDFQRIIILRTGSNFDRPPPGVSSWHHLTQADQNGFGIALSNMYTAGIEVVRGILQNWSCTFWEGIPAHNYVGDIFGSLGGEPDFGPGAIVEGGFVASSNKSRV